MTEKQKDKTQVFAPMGLAYVELLPRNRAYSEVEAGFSLAADNFHQNPVTVTGYAKLWGWSVGKVYRFLDKVGAEIVYPKSTKIIQKQCGVLVVKRNEKRNENGMMFFIDISELQRIAECKRNEKRKQLKKSINSKDKISSPNHILIQSIVDAYHSILPSLPKVRGGRLKDTDSRTGHIRARIRDEAKRADVSWWHKYFDLVAHCPFLVGDNARGWRVNLDWLVQKTNMQKVIELNYLPNKEK